MRARVLLHAGGLLAACLLGGASVSAESLEGFFNPPGSLTVEVSLENAPGLHLPINRSAITSLAVVGDHVLGGTTAQPGLDPFLFVVSLPEARLMRALDLGGMVPGQLGVQSGFGRGERDELYAGTMPDRAASGHLLGVRLERGAIAATDLGSPVPGEGVFALTAHHGVLYGVAHPSGRFFSYRLEDGHVRVFEDTVPSAEQRQTYEDFELAPADYLSRRLVVDGAGRVFGSVPINRIFLFDPETETIEVLPSELPAVWDRRVLGRVDAWAVASDGTLYGGSAGDGLLFRLDPDDGAVVNLGSPASTPRLKGLAFAADGRLWGLAGAAPQYSHLFFYDLETGGFTDLGNPAFPILAPGLPEGVYWRGFQLGTLAVSEDGCTLVMGDEGVLSQLMVFSVREVGRGAVCRTGPP
jgi:hypothetical protein